MSGKPTPGPWNMGDSDLPVSMVSIHGHTGRKHSTLARIVSPDAVGMPVDEGLANARLIAAAPELLAALETLGAEEGIRDDDDPILMAAREKARAAIRKATGEQS